MSKLVAMETAVDSIPDGATLALGGNTLNRAPMEAVFGLIRRQKKGLHLIKTAGGMDVDLLCMAECVSEVDAGFISLETEYGLAQRYRRAVQEGKVKANEHACYTVISALRAASYGIPFMPVRGLQTTDLRKVNDYFRDVTDPFSGETLAAVRAIRPDVAVVHVHYADEQGNALIEGPKYDDVLMTRASRRVIVTAEKIVQTDFFTRGDRKADIPHFMVSHVVRAPLGSFPGACYRCYPPDDSAVRTINALPDRAALMDWLGGRVNGV